MTSDTHVWDQIRETVAQLGRAEVRAGVVGAKATEPHGNTGQDNAEIALWMEYGTKALPERSFIRKTLDDPAVQTELAAMMADLTGRAILGQISRDEVLAQVGAWVAERIKRTIEDDKVTPELQPSTVAHKGSNKVLVESHQLVNAIGWEIVK